jgi:hypothetical protein
MLEYLELGHNYFGDGFGPDPDVDEMRAVWKQHRAELLTEARPGNRPWAWWQFESPEPRALSKDPRWLGSPLEHQTLQLLRMGEIGEVELVELKQTWALYAPGARTPADRRHYGIPEWYSTESEQAAAATELSEE